MIQIKVEQHALDPYGQSKGTRTRRLPAGGPTDAPLDTSSGRGIPPMGGGGAWNQSDNGVKMHHNQSDAHGCAQGFASRPGMAGDCTT